MSNQRRGGARLEKNMPQKRNHSDRHPNTNTGAPSGQKRPAKRKGGTTRRTRIMLIVLAVLVVLVFALLLWYKSWAKLPTLPGQTAQLPSLDPITGEYASQNPMINSPRKKEFYTFLLVGRDTGGGGNTDTMMLAAYDIPNQKLAVMSLPRDTMVDARHPDHNRKLNGVWNLGLYYAKKDEKRPGITYLKEAIGDMIGFAPDFHIIVNWEAFGRLVDAIGGVEFEVPFNMQYSDPSQNLYINVAAGRRLLTGKEAMGVVRWRHNNSYSMGYANGDLGRIQTQQALMKEIVKKCLKIENVTKINQFATIFTEEVETDLTMGNLVAFAERAIFGGLTMENVVFTTMPNTPVYVGAESYVQANPEELLGMLNESFNPYRDELTMEVTHILQYRSSTGYYTYTGTGTGTRPTYTNPKPAPVAVRPEPTPDAEPSGASPSPGASGSPGPSAPASLLPPGAGGMPPGIGDPDDDLGVTTSAVPGGIPGSEPPLRPAVSQPPVEVTPDPAPTDHEPVHPGSDTPAGIPMD